MKRNNVLNKIVLAGGFLLAGLTTSSCEDFLTIYPTDKISEEDFWTDKNDLENVRTAAYRQFAEVAQKVLIWGECRSDNLVVSQIDKTAYVYLQDAILMPTQNMFDWSGFYTGINFCNKVLEKGQEMVDNNVDPSFMEGDWQPVKAEMLTLRALYYFYLVRAYRDVPYVDKSVSTDVEAMRAHHPATPGVMLLGTLIDQLEEVKDMAATNFGLTSDNKGRFTKRGLRALLADMYLWRGCMLRHQNDTFDSEGNLSNAGKGDGYVDEEGNLLPIEDTNRMSAECFDKAVEHASWVIDELKKDYDDYYKNMSFVSSELLEQPYPLTQFTKPFYSSMSDVVYDALFSTGNSRESVFEFQYDGDKLSNGALDLLSTYDGSTFSGQIMTANPLLFTSATAVDPAKGYGKTDVRFLSTARFEKMNQSSWPVMKNIADFVTIEDMSDMSEGYGMTPSFKSTKRGNWPIYRLSDMMLIKAEALARSNKELAEGFKLVNALFARNNPYLEKTGSTNVDAEYISTRLDDNYAEGKTASDLLTLVYKERQLDFIGEGKRWFDLVRQAEYDNSTTTALETMMGATKSVQGRLRQLPAMYNPIYSEELKVNGVGHGGYLVQNPVWDRYTKN